MTQLNSKISGMAEMGFKELKWSPDKVVEKNFYCNLYKYVADPFATMLISLFADNPGVDKSLS